LRIPEVPSVVNHGEPRWTQISFKGERVFPGRAFSRACRRGRRGARRWFRGFRPPCSRCGTSCP